MTHKEENIVNIAMRAAELLKDGKIERNDITGHAGLTEHIISLAEKFEQAYRDVDFNASDAPDYWEAIDSFAEQELIAEFGPEQQTFTEPLSSISNEATLYAVSAGGVKKMLSSGDYAECLAIYESLNGEFMDENNFVWDLELEDHRDHPPLSFVIQDAQHRHNAQQTAQSVQRARESERS